MVTPESPACAEVSHAAVNKPTASATAKQGKGRWDETGRPRKAAGGVLPGEVAFKLYDTYGLAVDEQEEMAREIDAYVRMAKRLIAK